MDTEPIFQSTLNLTNYILHSLPSLNNGRKFSSICHRVDSISLNRSHDVSIPLLGGKSPCFTPQSTSPKSFTQTLSFIPGTREDFISALTRHARIGPDENGVRFNIEAKQIEQLVQMKSGRWIGYAARALVMRFWELAKVRFPLFFFFKL